MAAVARLATANRMDFILNDGFVHNSKMNRNLSGYVSIEDGSLGE